MPQSDDPISAERRQWERPTITELKVGTETKANDRGGPGPQQAEPPQPAASSTKLGFAFEWAFPLSARRDK
jgi:hypothetical protein